MRETNRMQEAVDRLMDRLQEYASVTITYMRGPNVIASGIRATVGRTPFEVQDGEIWTAFESRDYLLAKEDIGVEPASADIIIEESNGRKYEVSVPKPLFVFESIGPHGSVYKIHTKGISE